MDISLEDLDLSSARMLRAIPSGYSAREVYAFRRTTQDAGFCWNLKRVRLERLLSVRYDDGSLDEWIETYAADPGTDRLRFLAAAIQGETVGLLTWAYLDWNETVWLIDIRVASSHKRAGVGRSLVTGLADRGDRLRARGIHVETQIHNTPAMDFYRAQGFEISGFNEHLYSNSGLEEQDVAVYLFLPLG